MNDLQPRYLSFHVEVFAYAFSPQTHRHTITEQISHISHESWSHDMPCLVLTYVTIVYLNKQNHCLLTSCLGACVCVCAYPSLSLSLFVCGGLFFRQISESWEINKNVLPRNNNEQKK